jgi:tripartite-type tricarboxylate transporter receptor subunit TctC
MHRRTALAATLGVLAVPLRARAQEGWPSRPIRLVVPFPPGGSGDLVARLIQPRLTQLLGQPVQLEHRGGAAGSVGAGLVARAAPDGHTWLLASEALATADALGALSVGLNEGFTPCSAIGSGAFILAAHPRTGFATFADLVAAAKARPGTIGYATNGSGSGGHVAGVALQRAGGFTLDHVPYRGAATALADAVEGLVPLLLLDQPAVIGAVREGRITALASTQSATRGLSGVPALASLGLSRLELRSWWMLVGPAGLPPAIAARMQGAIAAAIADAAIEARLADLGIEPLGADPAATRDFLTDDLARWSALVREFAITTAS